MARILVTGVGGPAGGNVARLLLKRGHHVIGADMRKIEFSGIKFRLISPAGSATFLDELYNLSLEEGAELLIPTVSEELPLVAAGQARWEHIPVVIASGEAVSIANDKYLTCQNLSAQGVAVPRFALPSQVKCLADITEKIGWPCLSKPCVGRGGRGVTVYYEKDWESIRVLDDSHILQEFASGTDYCPNLYLNRSGNAVVFVLEKTKLKEGIIGNAVEVRRVDAPDVAALAVSAGKALGFNGPLDVDVRRRADGAPVVLEINARFGANVTHAPEVLDAMLIDNGFAR